MAMILAEELLLLGLRDEQGTVAGGASLALKYGLGGAILAELLLLNRLRLEEKDRVALVDDSPTGDDVLDEALTAIAKRQKPRSLRDWVRDFGGGRLQKVQDRLTRRLVDRGILREEEGRFLWVFPTHHFPTVDPTPEQRLRDRIHGVILYGSTPDERTLILLSLLKASKLVDEVFPPEQRKEAGQRIQALAKDVAAGPAVAKAIAATQAALIAVIASTTVVSTTAGSSG